MVEDGLQGLHRLRASLVAITLSFGCLAPHCSEAAFPPETTNCPQRFVQHDPIALGCRGGNKKIKLGLTQVGTPHHLMLWQAPAGTKDLRATAKLSPQGGGKGRGALKVACSGSGQVLLGSDGEHLNDNTLHAKIHGAHWQWSGNQRSTFGESFEEWFRVNGTLPCDVEVSFTNEDASRLIGYLQYEWTGIDPCPAVPLGCKNCSEQQATCDDRGLVAVCDGSPFVDCMTAADAKQAFVTVAATTTTTIAAALPTTSLLVPMVPTTAAALPTTSLLVPMTYELAGAFALEIQTTMDVNSDAFHEMLLVALAESLGIHRKAFAKLNIVEVGHPNNAGRLLQQNGSSKAAETVQAVEATAGAIIIGVGYELFTGSAEREKEIKIRLNNLGGPSSRMRVSLVDILTRHGVSLKAVQVTYPAATVAQAMHLLVTVAPQSLPGGGTPTLAPVIAPAHGPALMLGSTPAPALMLGTTPAPVGFPISTQGPLHTEEPTNFHLRTEFPDVTGILYELVFIVIAVGLVVIVCWGISRCCCRTTRREPTGEQDRLSRAEAGVQRPAKKGASSAKIAKDTDPRYHRTEPRYEPVNPSEEGLGGSVSSPNRAPSVASDSSEAAGLRLLGNDGM